MTYSYTSSLLILILILDRNILIPIPTRNILILIPYYILTYFCSSRSPRALGSTRTRTSSPRCWRRASRAPSNMTTARSTCAPRPSTSCSPSNNCNSNSELALQCCGASGPSDWAESRYNQADDKSALEIGIGKVIGVYKVPESCCKSTVTQDDCETKRQVSLAATFLDRDIIYSTGCASKIMELVQQHDYIVLAVVLAILLIEAMAMIFSMVLCCAVRRIDHFKA
ncbi:hypothetical protein HAZT_HAZT001249 [Hyalella azteca]|uniref:Tetraspanin n=1 Tax=Hyalella azteca TaxID=294128 RepID=A0A6A0GXA2_HYAAZ|nr:hypothetical protein HAZT_HAZT001249 [Hyalella azteca]